MIHCILYKNSSKTRFRARGKNGFFSCAGSPFFDELRDAIFAFWIGRKWMPVRRKRNKNRNRRRSPGGMGFREILHQISLPEQRFMIENTPGWIRYPVSGIPVSAGLTLQARRRRGSSEGSHTLIFKFLQIFRSMKAHFSVICGFLASTGCFCGNTLVN